ncbi:hypothetical protein GDO86_020432 [Hymenochirus boettgeri]|uniref:G-protein coupled receptors family 1 profile domain-containing protein n=1 Tax=Hymenochirus boettgeri TaxID=247094 RepID=A0A8T2IF58_9PIPI|nr:hypothetical protein GDO86_020432 [Hymenochirus boettgeri]
MQNSTTVSHPLVMTLTFGEMTSIKYLYCVFVLVGYVLINLANSTVIAVIHLCETLQKPMYIFISTLCFNGLYGSFAFYPSLFINLLYKAQTISYVGCILQVFTIHTYGANEMTILTVMGFDRYVSICNPLRYNTIMSMNTVYKLIAGAWLYSFFLTIIHIILTIRLPLCDSVILKIYCDNWSVVRLSCVDTTVNNIYGIFIIVAILVIMPLLVFISYVEILRVCARSSKDFRSKALQTCAPHLISITNYLVDVLFELILYRLTPTNFPYALRVFMSVNFLVVPPLLNPLVYGFKTREIRIKMAKLLLRKLCQ